ncbi:MAG: cyclic beta 1-2 glucan synthetase [Deltaproteobacteria bacterium]|nr:cyclic beta 1-2 glucan synthetase [Deltaproteobacteria bacterium]
MRYTVSLSNTNRDVAGRRARLGRLFGGGPASSLDAADASSDEQAPLRAELFSIAQLERHAQTLAGWHKLGETPAPDLLLPRLGDNEAVLADAYALVSEAVSRGRQITPAAEWFVDNYHLIEEQIRIARLHLPRGYSRELPRLVNGATGTPRVYDIAIELISHAHGRVDLDALRAFVAAYQAVQPLLLGELWAIPIMLRLALLENLRRVVTAISAGRHDREQAGVWANKLLDVPANDPSRSVLVLAELIEVNPPLTHAFVSELVSRIQGQGLASVFPMSWLEHRLAERGQTIEHAFQLATQSQAADQVLIGNSIGSLRFLGATDWRDFVETMSVIDHALRADPAGVYTAMNFATRDRYRHVVEQLARRSPLTELAVANAAVALAGTQTMPRMRHVGYFLIDAGRRTLERVAQERFRGRTVVRRIGHRLRLPIYVGAIAAIAGAVTSTMAVRAPAIVELPPWAFVVWVVAIALASSQLAIAVVHWAATLLVPPHVLPRLDFSQGIPATDRTIVAVPTMLGSAETIDELADALEVRFLANRDPNLGFALVSDLRDADEEVALGDDALVARARDAIDALNVKYPEPTRGGGFFLFHRNRRWNPREGVWMGWERKRGKLEDLNAMLRGDAKRFDTVTGPIDRLHDLKYVIVLDSDTELPRDSARELAASLAHPLNRAVFDAARGRVTEGYAILQPRVGITLASANSSRFARLFAGDAGIDPYTRAVSDVYQDVFGEGSFIGKGIYDIDAVEQAMRGKLPENRILSHDLLEGAYCRSGLVSDVILFEDHPTAHCAEVSRRARWIRGDWQIARWLSRRVPGGDRRRIANPISRLSQWKIVDNLRRSLVPPALLALLLVGWLVPGAAGLSLGVVAATLFVPALLAATAALARRPTEVSRGQHVREITQNLVRQVQREGFALACLPYDVLINLTSTRCGSPRRCWHCGSSRPRWCGGSACRSRHRHLG